MTNFKSLTIWTLVLDFFILVGAGHGLLCIGILEILSIIAVVTGHFISSGFSSFSLTASYDDSLITVGIFSLLGQILIIISFFVKGQNKFWIKIVGLLFLFTGFYYLTHNFINDGGAQLGLIVGIPFLILSGILIYKMIKENFK
jgi:hypothetical protein